MERREFISLLAGAAASPFAAYAQQRVPRVGVLTIGGPELDGAVSRGASRDFGYVEGRRSQLEIRSAQGQPMRLPELAAELVRGKVDVIVASLTPRFWPRRMRPGTFRSSWRRRRSGRDGTGRQSRAAGGQCHRPLGIVRRVGGEESRTDPRDRCRTHRRVWQSLAMRRSVRKAFPRANRSGAQATRFEIQSSLGPADEEIEDAFAAIRARSARSHAVILQGSLPTSWLSI